MSALHVFDMDGTLLRGTTASLEISRRLDRLEPLRSLEERFATEAITAAEFAVATRDLWHDLTPEVVADVVAAAPWIDGIADVCADLRERGEHSMLITMSPAFFAEHLHEQGIDVVRASAWPTPPFTAAIEPELILSPADKPRLADAERKRLGLPVERCVAYGDSMSDVPLFDLLAHTVAVNADEHVRDAAAAVYHGGDLREAYALGRALLDGEAGS